VRPLADEELADLDKRMKMMQGFGSDKLLFGLVDNPFYSEMKSRRSELEAELAKDEADKAAARDKAKKMKRRPVPMPCWVLKRNSIKNPRGNPNRAG